MKTILIIGATGNVGGEVVKALQGRHVRVVAAVTETGKAEPQLTPDTRRVRFVLGEGASHAPAFQGVDTVFLLRHLLSVPITFHLGPTSISWAPRHKRNPQ